jgi:hypothetical protein
LLVALEQHKDTAQQFSKRKMVGDDYPSVMTTGDSGVFGEPDEIFDVES